MLGAGLRLVTSIALSGAEVALDAGRAVLGDDLIDIRPGQFRRLLLTFEESIQGRIPEILGDDDEERVETLVRLLRGTSEQDVTALIGDLQVALSRLYDEEHHRPRRSHQNVRSIDDRRRTDTPRPLRQGESRR